MLHHHLTPNQLQSKGIELQRVCEAQPWGFCGGQRNYSAKNRAWRSNWKNWVISWWKHGTGSQKTQVCVLALPQAAFISGLCIWLLAHWSPHPQGISVQSNTDASW